MAKNKKQTKKINWKVVAVIFSVVLVCVIAAIPLSHYVVKNRTYISIDEEKVSRLKYEYFFHGTRLEYEDMYMTLMAGMGMNMGNETEFTNMTLNTDSEMKDAVDQATVNELVNNIALLTVAKEEGFSYDARAELAGLMKRITHNAEEAEVSVKEYVKNNYGTYASTEGISDFFKEEIEAAAFYDYKKEQFAPTQEQLQEYYEAHKEELALFDLRMTVVKADTLKKADDLQAVLKEAEANIWTEGILYEGVGMNGLNTVIAEWMQNPDRKANDSTVVKNPEKEIYYVLGFIDCYPDISLTADIRILKTDDSNSDKLLELWKQGEATEESFAELCMIYSEDVAATKGGFKEAVTQNTYDKNMEAWIFSEDRVPGDSTAMISADGYGYVLYYVRQNECAWKVNVKNKIVSEKMAAFMDGITADIEVKDAKNKLKYDD